jgi:hypothetical protein
LVTTAGFQNRSSELPTADDQADPVTARSYDSAARTLGDHPPGSTAGSG